MSLEIADAVSSVMASFAHHLLHAARPFLSSMAQAFVHVVAQQPAAGCVLTSGLCVERTEQVVGERHHHLGHDPSIPGIADQRPSGILTRTLIDPHPPSCQHQDPVATRPAPRLSPSDGASARPAFSTSSA